MQKNWVESTTPTPVLESAWAIQILPDITNVSSASHSKLGEEVAKIIISRLKPLLYPPAATATSTSRPLHWDLHSIQSPGTPWQSKMAPLTLVINKSLATSPIGKFRLKGKSSLLKSGDVLVQCALKEATTASVSVATVSRNPFFWERPIPYPSGFMQIPETGDYPAASFRKCKEILVHMGIHPTEGLKGKSVVELGAMPGGWTMVLLEAGAHVSSVDWAQLEHPWLTSHPLLTHRCEDAREFDPIVSGVIDPSGSVDYLFADLALPPEKSLVAFERWLQGRWTKAFAWTFKFGFHTGDQYALMIQTIRKSLETIGGDDLVFSIRHLYKHENEIVVLGGWKSMVQEPTVAT